MRLIATSRHAYKDLLIFFNILALGEVANVNCKGSMSVCLLSGFGFFVVLLVFVVVVCVCIISLLFDVVFCSLCCGLCLYYYYFFLLSFGFSLFSPSPYSLSSYSSPDISLSPSPSVVYLRVFYLLLLLETFSFSLSLSSSFSSPLTYSLFVPFSAFYVNNFSYFFLFFPDQTTTQNRRPPDTKTRIIYNGLTSLPSSLLLSPLLSQNKVNSKVIN